MARYEALKEPMIARKQKLADSLRLQQLFRDVEDEETWIREKEPIAASTNRGQSASIGEESPSGPKGTLVRMSKVKLKCTGTRASHSDINAGFSLMACMTGG